MLDGIGISAEAWLKLRRTCSGTSFSASSLTRMWKGDQRSIYAASLRPSPLNFSLGFCICTGGTGSPVRVPTRAAGEHLEDEEWGASRSRPIFCITSTWVKREKVATSRPTRLAEIVGQASSGTSQAAVPRACSSHHLPGTCIT